MRELRHTCICLCATCERLGCGAFGEQPDGSEPLRIEPSQNDAPSGPAMEYHAAPVLPLALTVEAPTVGTVHL